MIGVTGTVAHYSVICFMLLFIPFFFLVSLFIYTLIHTNDGRFLIRILSMIAIKFHRIDPYELLVFFA